MKKWINSKLKVKIMVYFIIEHTKCIIYGTQLSDKLLDR